MKTVQELIENDAHELGVVGRWKATLLKAKKPCFVTDCEEARTEIVRRGFPAICIENQFNTSILVETIDVYGADLPYILAFMPGLADCAATVEKALKQRKVAVVGVNVFGTAHNWEGVDKNAFNENVAAVAEIVSDKYQDTLKAFDLPEFENFGDVADSLPELAPELIQGVLRQGHKMLLCGDSKAGKSFLSIELALAVAGGTKWLKMPCKKGRVIYINLEIDGVSFMHRCKAVADAIKAPEDALRNLAVWNLRGSNLPIVRLVDEIEKRCRTGEYALVILDPIYKVQQGDENSAGDIGRLCNELDRICESTGASLFYSHHHGKGNAGNRKIIDRAVGSGVFARDADALLTILQLEEIEGRPETKNAFILEGNAREFPPIDPFRFWFRYPIHEVDDDGILTDVFPVGDGRNNLVQNMPATRSLIDEKHRERVQLIENAFMRLHIPGKPVQARELCEECGLTLDALRKEFQRSPDDYEITYQAGGKIWSKTEFHPVIEGQENMPFNA